MLGAATDEQLLEGAGHATLLMARSTASREVERRHVTARQALRACGMLARSAAAAPGRTVRNLFAGPRGGGG
jgi:hypothetical protein